MAVCVDGCEFFACRPELPVELVQLGRALVGPRFRIRVAVGVDECRARGDDDLAGSVVGEDAVDVEVDGWARGDELMPALIGQHSGELGAGLAACAARARSCGECLDELRAQCGQCDGYAGVALFGEPQQCQDVARGRVVAAAAFAEILDRRGEPVDNPAGRRSLWQVFERGVGVNFAAEFDDIGE